LDSTTYRALMKVPIPGKIEIVLLANSYWADRGNDGLKNDFHSFAR
jgi:hypothetical protein